MLSDEIAAYVDQAVARQLKGLQTAVGTVVTSPSQTSTDILTVTIDGSARAVQVKGLRGFPVFPGARVALIRFGSDWTLVGGFTNPGAGTGTSRMVIGADTPPELQAYGIDVAILTYITDVTTHLEVGYFFIGSSNRFDGNGDNRVQAFGNVVYPTPGVPSSATSGNVKTNFQQNMFAPYPQTIFKDQTITLWHDLNMDTVSGFKSLRIDSVEVLRGHVAVGIGATTGTLASCVNAGPEVAVAAGNWSTEPNPTFVNGHMYRIDVTLAGTSGAAAFMAAVLRLRKGSATITGQILGSAVVDSNSNVVQQTRQVTFYVKNVSGGDITTKLSLTVSAGATGTYNLFSNATTPLWLIVQDLGPERDRFNNNPGPVGTIATAVV